VIERMNKKIKAKLVNTHPSFGWLFDVEIPEEWLDRSVIRGQVIGLKPDAYDIVREYFFKHYQPDKIKFLGTIRTSDGFVYRVHVKK